MNPIKIVCAILLLSAQVVCAQRTINPKLAALRDEKDSIVLVQKLEQLKNSSDEADLRLLIQYYGMNNQNSKAEDIFKLAQQRFPKGESAFIAAGNELITESDPKTKEKLYQQMVKNFPKRDYTMQQYSIADAYAQINDRKKVLEYAKKFTDLMYLGQLNSILAEQMLKNNDLATAEYLIKPALDSARLRMQNFDSTKLVPGANARRSYGSLQSMYYSYLTTYARVLFKQGKINEAYNDAKEAYDHSNKGNIELNDFYTTVLLSMNKMQEALPLMETAIKHGVASEDVKSKLKNAYTAVHGSENGFTAYKEKLDQELYDTIKGKVAKMIINKPSFDFTLTDVNGRPVSLHDLKGKTVILDFWATWCGPCKKSFPAMQLAVDKYKDDPNVKFLFIHTWERGKLDPAVDAKKYITDHNYSFEVLVDRKDPGTGINKVVSDYGVTGIPTKFIIDGNGAIRFQFTGFNAGDDAALAEISSMIEMCKKS